MCPGARGMKRMTAQRIAFVSLVWSVNYRRENSMYLNQLKQLAVVGVIFAALCLIGMLMIPTAEAADLAWDRNTEADMKDYQVWACFTPSCVVIKSPANLQATVPQSASGVVPKWTVPAGQEGSVAVSARDQSLNESGLSVAVPFDVKAPLIPANPRLQ